MRAFSTAIRATVVSLTKPRHFIVPDVHHLMHRAHLTAHLTYFGAVFHEAHGVYGKCAGVLFVITLLSIFTGDAE